MGGERLGVGVSTFIPSPPGQWAGQGGEVKWEGGNLACTGIDLGTFQKDVTISKKLRLAVLGRNKLVRDIDSVLERECEK